MPTLRHTTISPLLVCFKGHPGSGKSTLAQALSMHSGWPLVDKDDIRDVFQAQAKDESSSSASPDWNKLAYQVMFSIVGRQLSLGLTVVMDCPLSRQHLYETATQLAATAGAVVVLIECECKCEETWRQRLERRGMQDVNSSKSHKPATWQQLQHLLKGYEGCWKWSTDGSCEVMHHIMIDTSQKDEKQALQGVLDQLQEKGLLGDGQR